MRIYLLIISFCLFFIPVKAQQFADSKFYLTDSLILDSLPSRQRLELDSVLKLFHSAKTDTAKASKLDALSVILENSDAWLQYTYVTYVFAKEKIPKHEGKNDTIVRVC